MENRKRNEEMKMQALLGKSVLKACEQNCKRMKCKSLEDGTQDRTAERDFRS